MPERTRAESSQAGTETWFLVAWRDAQVNIVPKPLVSVHVPIPKICTAILRRLDTPRIDVLQSIPANSTCHRIDALVAQTGEDAGALGQSPHTVVLQACREANHVEVKHLSREGVGAKTLLEHEMPVIPRAELQKSKDPDETSSEFPHGRCGTARNLSPLTGGRLLCWVNGRWHIKHGAVDPALVLVVVERRTGQERRKEQDVSSVVQQARQFDNPPVFLEFR